MNRQELIAEIRRKKSFLCVGLDPDPAKIPQHLSESDDPVFEFNKAIIDATHKYAVAYKPNTAFYEAQGIDGWRSLERTIGYLNENYPEVFTIADAKRGDIGNTSSRYAKAFFEALEFDAITVAPYMGKDSVEPFLEYKNKFTILLALTSNEGAFNFQTVQAEGKEIYRHVLKTASGWKNSQNLMYVIGATKGEYFKEVRKIVPDNFLLVPGVGAQGGNLEEVCEFGLNKDIGLLVNSSRSILYASSGKDFSAAAAEEAKNLGSQMSDILKASGLL